MKRIDQSFSIESQIPRLLWGPHKIQQFSRNRNVFTAAQILAMLTKSPPVLTTLYFYYCKSFLVPRELFRSHGMALCHAVGQCRTNCPLLCKRSSSLLLMTKTGITSRSFNLLGRQEKLTGTLSQLKHSTVSMWWIVILILLRAWWTVKASKQWWMWQQFDVATLMNFFLEHVSANPRVCYFRFSRSSL